MAKTMNVGVLAYQGCLASELFGFRDMLAIGDYIAARLKAPRLSVQLITAGGRRVKTSGGESLNGADGAKLGLDLVVVPGFFLGDPRSVGAQIQELTAEAAFLRGLAAKRKKVASICVGAFVLGAAGFARSQARHHGVAVRGRTCAAVSVSDD